MLLTTLLTATTGAGATYVMSRRQRLKERRAAWMARLAAHEFEVPLELGHVSPSLAAVAMHARLARRALETPFVRVDQPGGVRDYDLGLAQARHAVWEWLVTISRLETLELEVLRRLRLDPRPLRSMVFARGVFERDVPVFEDPWFPPRIDADQCRETLLTAIEQLRRFEVVIASHRPSTYR